MNSSSSESIDGNPVGVMTTTRRRIRSLESSENSSTSRNVIPANHRPAYMKISTDKKSVLIKCYTDGKSISESAEIAAINKNTAKSIINKYIKNGEVLVEKSRGGVRNLKLNTAILTKIEQIVEENSCITLKSIREKISESEHVQLSISSIKNGLKKLRITLKCGSLQVDRRNCPRVIEERKVYALHFSRNAPESREKLIFIDESGFNNHLRRTRARSKINTPANIIVPTVRGRNVSLIAAINNQGIVFQKIIAHSNVNSNIFVEFLKELFEKLEQSNITEAWLIMDNVSLHKTAEVRELVEQSRHTLVFLPPYSPMMNPIEEVFSKIKCCARNILANPGNVLHLPFVIEQSAATISATDCNNYYAHMCMQLPSAAAGEPL